MRSRARRIIVVARNVQIRLIDPHLIDLVLSVPRSFITTVRSFD